MMLLFGFLQSADVLPVLCLFFFFLCVLIKSNCFVSVDHSSFTGGNKLFRQYLGIIHVLDYHSKHVINSHQSVHCSLCMVFMESSGKENICLSKKHFLPSD